MAKLFTKKEKKLKKPIEGKPKEVPKVLRELMIKAGSHCVNPSELND